MRQERLISFAVGNFAEEIDITNRRRQSKIQAATDMHWGRNFRGQAK